MVLCIIQSFISIKYFYASPFGSFYVLIVLNWDENWIFKRNLQWWYPPTHPSQISVVKLMVTLLILDFNRPPHPLQLLSMQPETHFSMVFTSSRHNWHCSPPQPRHCCSMQSPGAGESHGFLPCSMLFSG